MSQSHGTRGRVRAREIEQAQEATAEAARARRRVGPRPPVIHDVPTSARFLFIRVLEGRTPGVAKQHGLTATWVISLFSYDDFINLCAPEEVSLKEGMPRGSWDVEVMGGVFERTKTGKAQTRLANSGDWNNLKEDFRQAAVSTGKPHKFRLGYTFKARAMGDDQRGRDTQRNTPENDSRSESAHSTNDTPAPGALALSQRPSATTRRLDSMTMNQRTIAQYQVDITTTHKCDICTPGYCYRPIPGGPHLYLSPGSTAKWAQEIKNGNTTKHKPPASLPECVKWKKMFEGATSSSGKSSESPQSTTPAVVNLFVASSPSKSMEMVRFSDSYAPEVPPSSPPPEVCTSEYAMLKDWVRFTQQRHANLGEGQAAVARIVDLLRAQDLGYSGVKHYLRKKDEKEWQQIEACGVSIGVALAMSQELYNWEASVKEGISYSIEHDATETSQEIDDYADIY